MSVSKASSKAAAVEDKVSDQSAKILLDDHLGESKAPNLDFVETAVELERTETQVRALAVVKSYSGWAAAAGFIPVPYLDLATIIGAQLAMLRSIAKIYDIKFNGRAVRPLLVALAGGGGALAVSVPAISLLKALPVVGTALGMLTLPALSCASCYAAGQVFISHFESGGTFLNFDPAGARAHYAKYLAEVKSI